MFVQYIYDSILCCAVLLDCIKSKWMNIFKRMNTCVSFRRRCCVAYGICQLFLLYPWSIEWQNSLHVHNYVTIKLERVYGNFKHTLCTVNNSLLRTLTPQFNLSFLHLTWILFKMQAVGVSMVSSVVQKQDPRSTTFCDKLVLAASKC